MRFGDPDARFFETTRGQLVMLLRASPRTVNELSAELNVSSNAIRAQLLVLERDGLVRQGGTVKGYRKPHYVYALTDRARHLFPRPFDALLNKLLSVLKRTVRPTMFLQALREVGKDIADEYPHADASDSEKLNAALAMLEDLGGSAAATEDEGRIEIRSQSCPFAEAVLEHPEVCKIVESAVSEITGKSASERCDRSAEPKCRFQIPAS